MCVCMHARVHVCVCVCVCERVRVSICACMCVYLSCATSTLNCSTNSNQSVELSQYTHCVLLSDQWRTISSGVSLTHTARLDIPSCVQTTQLQHPNWPTLGDEYTNSQCLLTLLAMYHRSCLPMLMVTV